MSANRGAVLEVPEPSLWIATDTLERLNRSIGFVRSIGDHWSMAIDIVRSLSSLARAHDLPAPPDMVAFRLRDIANSGMDITAVEQWVAENGGNTAVQPVPILSGVATWRPREESTERYFVVPLASLEKERCGDG